MGSNLGAAVRMFWALAYLSLKWSGQGSVSLGESCTVLIVANSERRHSP